MRIDESAELATAAARVEESTFALLGGWAPSIPEPSAKVLVAEHALHHAWHASLWRERAPLVAPSVGAPPARGVASVQALVDELAHDADRGTVDRLVAVYEVLADARRRAYETAFAACSEASDGPTIRVLTLILADQAADGGRGRALLAALAAGSDDARERAAEARGRLGVTPRG